MDPAISLTNAPVHSHHYGNLMYFLNVAQSLENYPRKTRIDEVIAQVEGRGGRFVREEEDEDGQPTRRWFVVPEQDTRVKVRQIFTDRKRKLDRKAVIAWINDLNHRLAALN